MQPQTQTLDISSRGLTLAVRRDDLVHPSIPGNKWRKLKYNLLQARGDNCDTLLTFGGAYSNHIAAVAAAGAEFGFKTIGIIRGDEAGAFLTENQTLSSAKANGMRLEFVSRETFQQLKLPDAKEALYQQYGGFYRLAEGGTNALAIKGCEEILTAEDAAFDYICCAVGTGGTIAGIANSAGNHQQVIGFPALKGDFLEDEIRKWTDRENWRLICDFHFGGYAKVTSELVNFMNDFASKYNVPLDPVYTGKMFFGVMSLIDSGFFPDGSKILAIHTGGLQGIAGMNTRLRKKNLPLINY